MKKPIKAYRAHARRIRDQLQDIARKAPPPTSCETREAVRSTGRGGEEDGRQLPHVRRGSRRRLADWPHTTLSPRRAMLRRKLLADLCGM